MVTYIYIYMIFIAIFLIIYYPVGGLEHGFYDFPFSWEIHHPNWRTHIFRGVGIPPTIYIYDIYMIYIYMIYHIYMIYIYIYYIYMMIYIYVYDIYDINIYIYIIYVYVYLQYRTTNHGFTNGSRADGSHHPGFEWLLVECVTCVDEQKGIVVGQIVL